ncbi:TIM barrel protein [Acidipila sp. EB88]|uniref:TIM barrel protein n=1 Tax=Acidipila sp. EB88 TaxID=2305226 RepID=UPI000F5F9DE1|nr:TIM barrel protein [Acidipila sp. EB88]RRA49188.1 sugar isomerase [Acidipila sp. EB88]
MTANNGASAGTREQVWAALDTFRIEIPSWGFANTGTRFGKFIQLGAATSIADKFADAGEVHRLTGASPTVALHVLWDLPNGASDVQSIRELEARHGVRAGSINPNLFQSQEYKFGSLANPSAEIRRKATDHLVESVEISRALGSRDVSIWVADGSNYPGSQSMRKRIAWIEEALQAAHEATNAEQRLLIEYKPFEPAAYHMDIADWGMAYHFARSAGPRAAVLVDTGHHYQGTNIEQIVAWLLHLNALGGFHFNDRKYADDDLTLGSIDPYQVFRIFHEMLSAPPKASRDVAYMIDQSHNLKGKMEAMVQSILAAQELYAKAVLVDRAMLDRLQDQGRIVEAEECFRAAFWTDVRPLVREWRAARNLPADPLRTLAESGYVQRTEQQRGAANQRSVTSYA